ncbi:MAG: TetR/AcrR family transcriptional regulator [Deltaproteobacteria bacterium]
MVKTKIKDPVRVQKKQKQIFRGAMKVFRTKGFHAASIREIAKACRISLGSLYDYIETKEDILFLVHKEILDQIYRRVDESLTKYQDPRDQLTHVLAEIFRLSFQLKDEILFIYTETKSLEKKYLYEVLQRESEFVEAIEAMIRRGVNEGSFDSSNPAVLANVIALTGAIIPLRGWNILPHYGEKEVVDELITIFQKGLFVHKVPTTCDT